MHLLEDFKLQTDYTGLKDVWYNLIPDPSLHELELLNFEVYLEKQKQEHPTLIYSFYTWKCPCQIYMTDNNICISKYLDTGALKWNTKYKTRLIYTQLLQHNTSKNVLLKVFIDYYFLIWFWIQWKCSLFLCEVQTEEMSW